MRFLRGSQNFGLDTAGSDKDYVQVLYPDLGDLSLPIPHPKEVKNTDGSMSKHIDIRAIPSLFFKSNLDMIQLLYSKEVVDGGCLEEYFHRHEHEISTVNLSRLYQSIMGNALNRFKSHTSKDLAHIIFGFKTLIHFEEQNFTDLRKCFEHNEHAMYEAIRNENYDAWIDRAKELEQLALGKKESYTNKSPNFLFIEQMNIAIGRMVIEHLSIQS